MFDFEYTHQCQGTTEASKKEKLFLISWCPDSAKIKKKMLYSSSFDALKKCLVGVQKYIQVSSSLRDVYNIGNNFHKLHSFLIEGLEKHGVFDTLDFCATETDHHCFQNSTRRLFSKLCLPATVVKTLFTRPLTSQRRRGSVSRTSSGRWIASELVNIRIRQSRIVKILISRSRIVKILIKPTLIGNCLVNS